MRIDGPELISTNLSGGQEVDRLPNPTMRPAIAGRPLTPKTPPVASLGALGPLEISLARSKRDLKRVQRLRYEVFYKHGSASADVLGYITRRDFDDFDAICDHLMVVDRSQRHSADGEPPVVGTYRLLAQEVAAEHRGFCSASQFDITGLLERHGGDRFLELGRACVHPAYRSRRAIELLWHGVWRYVLEKGVDVMIGCASFEGTNLEPHARPLSFLHHFALAPEPWRASAHTSRRVEMNMMERSEIDIECAQREIPPLIKGYLRAGAYVGDGAVIDPRFGTIDVLIVLPVAAINPRYIRYFGNEAQRHAAG